MNQALARHRHVLAGLRPEPLGSYLAGLGLVRVLGEQADSAATSAWTADGLAIETSVADIAGWLAREYVPTPVLSPWNGGSGFGEKDKEPKRRITELLAHPSRRLAPLREAIAVAREVSDEQRQRGWDKTRVVQEFRNRCPEELLPWIDAAVVLTDSKPVFPPLLGTGGNDGRLDFSTNFHQCLIGLLDVTPRGQERSLASARDLLDGAQTERLSGVAVGQFDPALAGGLGSSPFGAADSLVNPWEYVLLVEGALLFASGTARRHQHDIGRAARPFTVTFSPYGTPSGSAAEESRGEVWVPVWSRPCTLGEIKQLFGEARATWRGRPAQRAVEFYAATRTLGVASGIGEFVRYGLQQRNGLAFVAVPLERVQVHNRPEVRLAAELEGWVRRVRSQDASSAIGTATRRFDQAHLAYARGGGPLRLRDMLAALTTLEQAVGRSGRAKDKAPIWQPRAAQGFLDVFSEAECPELRIAVGLASCAGGHPGRTMRQLLLPVDPADPDHRRGRWRDSPVVPGFGLRPLRHVLADVLDWRSQTAADEIIADGTTERVGERFHGILGFRRGIAVPAVDLHAFARGDIDDAALDKWLRACLALAWWHVPDRWTGASTTVLQPVLGLLHPLAAGLGRRGEHHGGDAQGRSGQLKPDSPRLAMGPDWAARLAAGQVTQVHRDAVRRLRQAGWDAVPPVDAPEPDGRAIAAALVPRCRGALGLMTKYFAVPLRDDTDADSAAELADAANDEPTQRELAEELS